MDGAPSKPQPFRRLVYESSPLLMRPSQPLLASQFFQYKDLATLLKSLSPEITDIERGEIIRLSELGIPPITSRLVLSALLGVNPGLIWSFCHRTAKHYRSFSIKKGSKIREISAPKVALKLTQKWLSIHLHKLYTPPDHSYGFVPGRSHLDAAEIHCSAKWVLSVDIKDFFPSTPQPYVEATLRSFGCSEQTAQLFGQLTCLNGYLAQGAPTSPIISNLCIFQIDKQLQTLASAFNIRLTRYADDIVFSGTSAPPDNLLDQIKSIFQSSPWRLSEKKLSFPYSPIASRCMAYLFMARKFV